VLDQANSNEVRNFVLDQANSNEVTNKRCRPAHMDGKECKLCDLILLPKKKI
jgi:hypothetical protein